MPAIIGSHTFIKAPTTDRYLTLPRAEYLRKMSIGSAWTKIRIGMMCAVAPDGMNNLTGIECAFGLCAGTSNTYTSAPDANTNWLGARLNVGTEASGTLTYNAGSGNPYFTNSHNKQYYKIANNTGAFFAPGSYGSGIYPTTTGSLQRRSLFCLEIDRGTPPNFTVYFGSPYNATTLQNDVALTTLRTLLEYPAGATSYAYLEPNATTVIMTGQTTTLDETAGAGAFDTISLYWSNSSFPLYVYAIGYCKLL